jgi:hypothetical protein
MHEKQRMNCLENFYIQLYQKQGLLIDEQILADSNPLFVIIQN